ncbi:succinate dehydrogenase/fumarate reductase flavoprotein subunit, partial [candidate division KSB1 bacterium]
AIYAKNKFKDGKLTLDHVKKYNIELEKTDIDTDSRVAPMLLPDYSNPDVRKKQLTTRYVGTIR